MDEFKKDFKYYKTRVPPPVLDNVVDFDHYRENVNISQPVIVNPNLVADTSYSQFGLKSFSQCQVFTINKKKGLIFIKNPFTGVGQRYWISKCLRDYSRKPNKLNLDVHGDLEVGKNWWEECHSGRNELIKKLRWATLGYHHNWDTKVYTQEDITEFPLDLSGLCKVISKALGFVDYHPQASIVNYYHLDSTLAPHTDHSEKYLDAPLISISFGQTAVFLIGGESKDEKPLPMFIRSGDIVIMSKESRLCYHAVPRIIKATNYPWDSVEQNSFVTEWEDLHSETEWKLFGDYIANSRININVRQVEKNPL